MSTGTFNSGPVNINAGEDMLRYRIARYNKTTGFVEYCDAAEQGDYIVDRDVDSGIQAVLHPVAAHQFFPAVASGVITAGDRIAPDDDGKVQSVEADPSGHHVLGRALYAAAADLDEITYKASPQDTAPYTGQAALVADPGAAANLTAVDPAALTYADPAAITYGDPAALTSPGAGTGAGADGTTFSGAQCDAVVADITAICDALILLGADVPLIRTELLAAGADLGVLRTPVVANIADNVAQKTAIDANNTAIDATIDSLQAAGQMATV